MDLLFRNGRVIDPANDRDQTADVLVSDGKIADIQPRLQLGAERIKATTEIDAGGKWLVPGLIDMHVHLREPGEEYKETIASGTAAAVAGGFTAVACMPNTQPVNDCATVTQFILRRAQQQGFCRVFPVAAVSKGLQGRQMVEAGDVRDAGAVALSDDGRPVMNAQLMRRILEYSRRFDLPIISHAEDLDLARGGHMNEGTVATQLGLRGIPPACESVMVARDCLLAEWTGGRVHIAHVSTADSVRIIRVAKSRGVEVSAETAPHYFTLTDEAIVDYDPVFKVNPPLRTHTDLLAVKEGLADGTLDAIATDHAPHSVVEKDIEFEYAANGMIGLESALPLILELVRDGTLSPAQAISKVTVNPARILRLPHGTLTVGTAADITVIDPEADYTLDQSTFRSKGCNCPFHGRRVQGCAVTTVCDGLVRFTRTA